MKLFLIRHGESKGNKEQRFRGRADFELTENGIKQAHRIAEYIKTEKIEMIYTSPLKRAVQTAEIISNAVKTEYEISQALNNINLGVWEGKKKDYVEKHFKKEWNVWIREPEKLQIEGMESVSKMKKRISKEIKRIKK